MGLHGSHGEGPLITFIVWCAVGAAVGWLAGVIMGSSIKSVRIEEVLVGIFGAFIGGEFLADVLNVSKPGSFSIAAIGMAFLGAVVLLVLLRVMRGAVGPQRDSKSRAKGR